MFECVGDKLPGLESGSHTLEHSEKPAIATTEQIQTTEEVSEDGDVSTTVDAVLTTQAPSDCSSVTCSPAPEGYEDCKPLPPASGECCSTQYECMQLTTEGPTTVIVTTEALDNDSESSGANEDGNVEASADNMEEINEAIAFPQEETNEVEVSSTEQVQIEDAQSLPNLSGVEPNVDQNELVGVTNRIDTFVDTTTIAGEIQDDDDGTDYESFTNCEVEGKFYDYLDDVPSSNPCELCQCMNGGVICAVRECVAPAGHEDCLPLPPKSGECCSTEFECNVLSTTGAPVTVIVSTTETQSDLTTTLATKEPSVETTDSETESATATTQKPDRTTIHQWRI